MNFIHGGGFIIGAASSTHVAPDPQDWVRSTKSIAVQANYRLGALGFMAHPVLDVTDDAGTLVEPSGAFGLADQVAALEWIQRSIGAFGGDATRVTVVGESAGGFSICAMLASDYAASRPLAAGGRGLPFAQAALLSGPCSYSFPEAPFMGWAGPGGPAAGAATPTPALDPTRQLASQPRAEDWLPVASRPPVFLPPPSGPGHDGRRPAFNMLHQTEAAMRAMGCLGPDESADPELGLPVPPERVDWARVRACVYAATPDQVNGAITARRGILWFRGAFWFPTVNRAGPVFMRQPLEAFGQGYTAALMGPSVGAPATAPPRLRIAFGDNSDEGTIFVWLGFPVRVRRAEFAALLQRTVGPEAAANLMLAYGGQPAPASPAGANATTAPAANGAATLPPLRREALGPVEDLTQDRVAVARAVSDLWNCATRVSTRTLARSYEQLLAARRVPASSPSMSAIFSYYFAHAPGFARWPFDTFGAYHGAELAYIFGVRRSQYHHADQQVFEHVRGAFGRFVHGLIPWSPFRLAADHAAAPALGSQAELFFPRDPEHSLWSHVEVFGSRATVLDATWSGGLHCAAVWYNASIDAAGFLHIPDAARVGYREPVLSQFLNEAAVMFLVSAVGFLSEHRVSVLGGLLAVAGLIIVRLYTRRAGRRRAAAAAMAAKKND